MFTVGPELEQAVFASRLILESSHLLSTFAFLDLCNLEKEWLTSSYYWVTGKAYLWEGLRQNQKNKIMKLDLGGRTDVWGHSSISDTTWAEF